MPAAVLFSTTIYVPEEYEFQANVTTSAGKETPHIKRYGAFLITARAFARIRKDFRCRIFAHKPANAHHGLLPAQSALHGRSVSDI